MGFHTLVYASLTNDSDKAWLSDLIEFEVKPIFWLNEILNM